MPSENSSGHAEPSLWIAGLGSQYPPFIAGPEKFDSFAKSIYGTSNAGINQLLKINKATGIATRASINSYESGFGRSEMPPTITEIGQMWRNGGVNLAVQACKKALKEWGGEYSDVTHTIAVTCTDVTTPGYDLHVANKLGLKNDVKRMLLAGIGCAGGMTTMRVAAEIASGATACKRPARILCFACEVCTLNARCNLDETSKTDPADVSVAGALFSDGASAFVLCNDLVLTGDVVSYTNDAMKPMFERLHPLAEQKEGHKIAQADFDWALHPEGSTIISGVQQSLGLSSDQLRATKEIYKTRGNASSPTTVIVLDKLRNMGEGKDYVVAAAVGPGLNIEMSILRRCRREDSDDEFA
ncbi:hypothetical protein SNOG_09622 [Parastagonospora nodorum SN15]|uniref:Uncharacterized protein n=1 Tax=Phaeosphaeria nodorum (strain SN15 / ATCC MYA-4574 / FGSC 10173) TaxID=321614 RepID=Q0UF42_PHANO|nr:hypothetical protein SNOG_09622 [Parastagonospora nodorum SN15]EAT82887.2 hypothetical protein SNOG_09622 [Parastagonospora nodorum SN15]